MVDKSSAAKLSRLVLEAIQAAPGFVQGHDTQPIRHSAMYEHVNFSFRSSSFSLKHLAPWIIFWSLLWFMHHAS